MSRAAGPCAGGIRRGHEGSGVRGRPDRAQAADEGSRGRALADVPPGVVSIIHRAVLAACSCAACIVRATHDTTLLLLPS